MTDPSTWTPVSGCLPCPYELTGLPPFAERSGISQLPWFTDSGRGYFSSPIGATYTPLVFQHTVSPDGLPLLIATTPRTDVPLLTAIAAHEASHHAMESLIRMAQRRIANGCWRVLLYFVGKPALFRWRQFLLLNETLGNVTTSSMFLEELFATFWGFQSIRSSSSSKEALKEESAFVNTQVEQFGSDFLTLYDAMGLLSARCGPHPLTLLYHCCHAQVQVDQNKLFVPSLDSWQVRTRLGHAIASVYHLSRKLTESEIVEWSLEDWERFLSSELPGFSDTYELVMANADTILRRISEEDISFWDENRFSGGNPAFGSLITSGVNTHHGLAIFHPEKLASDAIIEEELGTDLISLLRDVRGTEMSVVTLSRMSGDVGLTLVPRIIGDELQPSYSAVVTSAESGSEKDSELRESAGALGAVMQWDGLRGQFYLRCGLRCPLYWEEGKCCGMQDLLRQCFRAGTWLQRHGIEFVRWEAQGCLAKKP